MVIKSNEEIHINVCKIVLSDIEEESDLFYLVEIGNFWVEIGSDEISIVSWREG